MYIYSKIDQISNLTIMFVIQNYYLFFVYFFLTTSEGAILIIAFILLLPATDSAGSAHWIDTAAVTLSRCWSVSYQSVVRQRWADVDDELDEAELSCLKAENTETIYGILQRPPGAKLV